MTHHDEPQRRRRHLPVGAAVAVIVCMIITLAGCSNTEPAPVPKADEPTTTPTPTEPAWQDKYSEKQLATYEAALDRWTEYETKSEPIYAAGKATPEAEKFFAEYYPSPIWQDRYRQLQGFEGVEAQSKGLPNILWSKAVDITKVSVKIKQCVDYKPVKRTLDGEPIKRPPQQPWVRTITLSKTSGYDWLIFGLDLPVEGNMTSCKP